MDYLEVTAKFDNNGRVVPLSFIWFGRKINIDKVTDMRPAASLKQGGQGMRYTCRVKNYSFYLFCDDNKWFIEKLTYS
ncbi:hypothetical protein QUV50_06700 [Phascolarctobacterium faecium]|nr:hypothetical protein [Phascolarctobacterium faecium]MDM8111469.1 hypothetical protein [Phascolarctobacterium faecium]